MKLHETQAKVALDETRFRVILAGRRWGKTTLSVQEMIGEAIRGDDRNIVYIAPTLQAARDIAWRELQKQAGPAITKTNDSRLEMTLRTVEGGESRISLRGWEAVETLRGQKFHFIVIDEVASMRNFFEGWQEVLLPALTDTKGGALFISTPKGFNHFYDLYKQEGADWNSYHFTTYDNPHIDNEEIEKLKQSTTEDRFAQEYLADFRKQEGLVYKEFDKRNHVYEGEAPKPTEKLLFIDFGYIHPAVVLTCIVADGKYWIENEWYATEQTDIKIADYAAAIPGVNKVYPDPANKGGVQELRNRKLNVVDVLKGPGSIESGIQKVREMFLQRRLFINERCTNLIWEMENYIYDPNRPDKETPLKDNDHGPDALRYGLTMHVPANTRTRAELIRHHNKIRSRAKNPAF